VKKTLAAIAASALGLGSALAVGGAPAQAVTPKCTNSTQHEVNPAVSPTDEWYMTCIPQYGMGKAEFTITTGASDPFPAGYSLDDGHQTITSTPAAAQVKSYFNTQWTTFSPTEPASYDGAFVNLTDPTVSTATSQLYDGTADGDTPMMVAYPIESAGMAPDGLPADCTPSGSGATYNGEYEVVYGPTTTHFSQTIGDVVHSVTVTYTPPPLYLGLNFDSADPGTPFDESKAICASSGGQTTFAPDFDASDTVVADDWILAAVNAITFPSTLETLSPADAAPADPRDPDDVVASTTTDFGSFAATSTPVLATTGVDEESGGEVGYGLLATGAILASIGFIRRRRGARLAVPRR
jgi:hypothetical protein